MLAGTASGLKLKRLIADKEISVYSVNGKSDDVLLYKNHEGKPFNVIVIGGDKLSRGLTLEGLTVSYFTRSSNTYDTLMQMDDGSASVRDTWMPAGCLLRPLSMQAFPTFLWLPKILQRNLTL